MKKIILLLITLGIFINLNAQRNMENLGRGLVAVRSSNEHVFVSWRVPGFEFNDSVKYNVYRGSTLIAQDLALSNYVDTTTENNTYQVASVINGNEQELCDPVSVVTNTHGANTLPSIEIPIKQRSGYSTPAIYVGDIDGDSEYDFVLGRITGNGNAPNIVEAYTRHGEFLWKLDGGPNSFNKDNISPGSATILAGHGDNLTVFDINSDGFAEVIVRTANGVIFGDGKVLESEYSNDKQFISVLEGTTGKEIARAEVPEDFINIGPMNGHMGIGYLDGINPSIIWSSKNRRPDRGFNMMVSAYSWVNDTLEISWKFNRETSGRYKPDGHNIRIMDVDGDGKDEVSPFGYVLDDDGSVLYNLAEMGVVHGDRFFIGDMDPTHEGLEGYGIQQSNPNGLIWYYYDAKTGEFLQSQYENPVIGVDYARGYVGDMDPRHLYSEFFTFTDGLYNVEGKRITTSKPDSYPNLRIWWDGDVLSENLDNFKMAKWDYIADIDDSEIRLYTFRDLTQDYRKAVAFYGDILGDWREEAVYISSDESSIQIFTTVDTTTTRIYTLPHNPGYRNCLTTRGYYQGHMTDFYIGTEMETPEAPKINILENDGTHPIPNGLYQIKSTYSGLQLDTVASLSQQETGELSGQIWSVQKSGDHYKIYSTAAKKYLGYIADSVGSSLYLADNGNSGLFAIAKTGTNSFTISPSTASTNAIAAYDTSGTETVFKFVETSDTNIVKFAFNLTGNNFDCNNDWKGSASYDDCGVCTDGLTGLLKCTTFSSGKYKIEHTITGNYLTGSDSNISLETETEEENQVWRVINSSGGFMFINEGSKSYLNTDGISAILGSASEKFRMERQSNKYYIKPIEDPGVCLQIGSDGSLQFNATTINDTNTFRFVPYTPPVNIKNMGNGNLISIYPNPATNIVSIDISKQEVTNNTVSIKNQIGQVVLKQKNKANSFTLDISALQSGIYILSVESDDTSRTFKLYKK